MPYSSQDIDSELLHQLIKQYFCCTGNKYTLQKGDVLVEQGEKNTRLFIIKKGLVAGYLDSGQGEKQEVFCSGPNRFVGVHSFFSKSFLAYATIIALEKTELSFIDFEDIEPENYKTLVQNFVPVLVQELSARQHSAKDVMLESQTVLKNLYQRDKLATLGQMAAGLAHELNNAIGVMKGNSEWLSDEVSQYVQTHEQKNIFSLFKKGIEKGQKISSSQARKLRKEFEKKLGIDSQQAQKLVLIEMELKEAQKLLKNNDFDEQLHKMHHFWQMGVAIHDVLLASKHSVHVLNSIKQLSVTDQARQEISVNDTLDEAFILLKKVIGHITVQYTHVELPRIVANPGELVQIWVNLIKNSCEGLKNAKITNPIITIDTGLKEDFITVSITDNGPGIPEETMDKIFRPNFTTKKGGLSFGLGLGLSIVQRLVDSYNGKIQVNSKPGKTSFIVKIPIN